MRQAMRVPLLAAAVASLLLAPAGRAAAEPRPATSDNVEHVANVRYLVEERYGSRQADGTDVELRRIGGRAYAFAGTYRNGLQIIDVTAPESPRLVAVYDCAIAQGDVQVFTQRLGDRDRVLVAYAADDYGDAYTKPTSRCFRENGMAGIRYGTFLVDVTDPHNPTTAGFVGFRKGSHNQSVHPSGRYLYNSNADVGPRTGTIEVVDISDTSRGRAVARLPLVTGADSHDITFSADGKRAYSAALTHTLVIDTTNPAKPSVIGRIVDPTIDIHHQSDPIDVGRRRLLIVSDELAGAAGNGACPGAGLHVFDVTGTLERAPVKVGYFTIPEVRPTVGESLTCTSHVLRIHPREMLMTIGWYAAGMRVVDLSGLADPVPTMTEVGYGWFDDSDTWAAKALEVTRDGTFHVFANDRIRGLDVFAVTLEGGRPPGGTPLGARVHATDPPEADRATAGAARSPYCVLVPQ